MNGVGSFRSPPYIRVRNTCFASSRPSPVSANTASLSATYLSRAGHASPSFRKSWPRITGCALTMSTSVYWSWARALRTSLFRPWRLGVDPPLSRLGYKRPNRSSTHTWGSGSAKSRRWWSPPCALSLFSRDLSCASWSRSTFLALRIRLRLAVFTYSAQV